MQIGQYDDNQGKKAEKSGQKLQKNECREKKIEPKNDKKTESTQRA